MKNHFIIAIAVLVAAACSSEAPRTASDAAGSDPGSTALSATSPSSDGLARARPTVDVEYAIVQLRGDPLATSAKTKPPQGKKVDFNSNTVKSYRAQLSALRNDFKAWLRSNAPGAKVTGEFDLSLNAVTLKLNGESLARIATAPQVVRAEYQGLYYPVAAAVDPDLALISALGAWETAGGPANAGAGVKVAIIDTGIDVTHPCFSDAGYAAQAQLGDRRFTNNKVIAAKVFNNKTPSQKYTAEALQEHGTHVAGTVACNHGTAATVDGAKIPYEVSGVAPKALLGNYNIFPGTVENARSEDILNALDAAYADGFDVANMSLGGGAHGIQDLLTVAVDDLDEAGMVVAVAAGNSGPGHYTVESPGSAARALTAGASSVGHFVAAPITTGTTKVAGLQGDFGTMTSDLTGTLAFTTADKLDTACGAITENLSKKIALLQRGTCSFSTKIRNAQGAGAAAVIVVNSAAGDPITMGQDGTANQPTIPAYMVAKADGGAMSAAVGNPVTIGAGKEYFATGNDDIMGDFSSQGPTDVDFRVKPDVVAPGVNILSSIPHQFCAAPPCFAFFQGTSMATPHLAGSAAFLVGEHRGWSAAQIRSAIVNTADQGVLKKWDAVTTTQTDVNVIGAGRENLASATAAVVALDPVSVSFGAVPSGSGQTRTFDVVVTGLKAGTYSVSVGAGSGGVSFSVAPSTVSLAAGESKKVTVTMTAAKGADFGDHQATLSIGSAAHAVVYTFVK